MNYIFIAIFAWTLYGILSILDKFLLDKPINDPNVYTFYTGAFAIFALLIFSPFARITSIQHLLLDLFCGTAFLIAQFFTFKAIALSDVSQVVPITGALVPVFSLAFVNYGLGIKLSGAELAAFALLVLGTVLISYAKGHITKKIIWPILSSVFFALYYSIVKLAYAPAAGQTANAGFYTNFSFVRLGSFITAMLMLFSPAVRKSTLHITKGVKKSTSGLFISKEVLGGVGFVILNYAIGLGNPALVNALQGFEYVAIFILALILTRYFPKIIKEDDSKPTLFRKSVAIAIIFAGLFILEFFK